MLSVLLFTLCCNKTWVLWSLIFTLSGMYWVTPKSVREALGAWCSALAKKQRRKAWSLATLCLLWIVCSIAMGLLLNAWLKNFISIPDSFLNFLIWVLLFSLSSFLFLNLVSKIYYTPVVFMGKILSNGFNKKIFQFILHVAFRLDIFLMGTFSYYILFSRIT